VAERGDSLSDLILLFRFLITGENENLPGKVFNHLALRPNPTSFLVLKQETEAKKSRLQLSMTHYISYQKKNELFRLPSESNNILFYLIAKWWVPHLRCWGQVPTTIDKRFSLIIIFNAEVADNTEK